MEEENNTIIDWNIENFSYWRSELHEKWISNPSVSIFAGYILEVDLYPRGLDGKGEYMVVKINEGNLETSGKLSFIGSDGSVIFTQLVDFEEDEVLLPPGPKFIDVFTQIKKNEGCYKDQLTLRFQFHLEDEYFEHLIMSTTIDVRKIPLKVDPELIESIEPPSKFIFRNKDVSLKTVLKDGTVKFVLEPRGSRTFLVETFISMVSSDNTLMRKEEQRRVFSTKEKASWTFSDSLKTEAVGKKGITVILRLVIIQEDRIDNFSSKSYYDKRVRTALIGQSSTRSSVFSVEDSVSELAKDYMGLYQDQEFSDFELKCGTASFPVHRNILSARSPVFKRLLSIDMKESASGNMDIVDLDTPTLARFLTFLYTGVVEDLQGESALKLYYAADKYQIPSLKRLCSNYLSANVSVSNVCDVLSLADKHQDQDLFATSHGFVLENYNEVLKSKEWEGFMEGEPLLAVKIVTHFAAKDCVVKKRDLE